MNLLQTDDVLYDVFAGVGPFSVPAVSKRGVSAVLANDLNPDSYRFLVDNYTRNNKSKTKKRQQDARRFGGLPIDMMNQLVVKLLSIKSPHTKY